MKKHYIKPAILCDIQLSNLPLLAGSGPGANDQSNPGISSGSSSSMFFDDEEDF